METKEDYDAYKYISPYARQRQRQLDIALTSKGALTTQARNYPDGGPLSSEIPCDPTPFNATEIISSPCPSSSVVADGAPAMDSVLNGILMLSCHGTVNFDYNLTTDYIIPYRMLFIYSTPFSFSGLAPANIKILSHRMNKLIHDRNNINNTLLYKIDDTCGGITTRKLLQAILMDSTFVEHVENNFRFTYDQAIAFATSKGIPTDHLGKPHIGTPLNQMYCFSNYYFYNNEEVHDSFSGLFLAAFCINSTWVSSNYMPIIFSVSPTKMQGVMPPNTQSNLYPESSLLDPIKIMPVYDLSSMRDIKKVKNMNNTLLGFIIKMLIARNVTFTSSIATIIKNASGQYKSTPIKLDYGFIDPNLVIIDNITETNINGLPVNNNNVKISRISSEDVSILLYVLWFISNGKWKEINVIMNYMNLMYFYYYHIMMKITINYIPTNQDELTFIKKIHNDTSLLPLAAITTFNILINNYIHEQATINKITFATIHSVCRPNAIVEQTNTVQMRGQYSQECEIALDCSPKQEKPYQPQKVTSAFPQITPAVVELTQKIVQPFEPIVQPFEPIVDETVETMEQDEDKEQEVTSVSPEMTVEPIQPPIIETSLITFYNFLDLMSPLKLVTSALFGRKYLKYFEDFPINQTAFNKATIKEAACNQQVSRKTQPQSQLEEETTENDDYLLFIKNKTNNILRYLKTGILFDQSVARKNSVTSGYKGFPLFPTSSIKPSIRINTTEKQNKNKSKSMLLGAVLSNSAELTPKMQKNLENELQLLNTKGKNGGNSKKKCKINKSKISAKKRRTKRTKRTKRKTCKKRKTKTR